MVRYIVVCFVCWVGVFHGLVAQTIRSSCFPFADELPSNEVTDVFQDKTGFIWIGTTDGLARYDGYSLQTFRRDAMYSKGLTDNRITCFEESERYVWIGTQSGLSRFDKQRMCLASYSGGLPEQAHIYALCTTVKGNLWISVGEEIYRMNKDGICDVVYRLTDAEGNKVHCNSFYQDADGTLWICSRSGLIRYDERNRRFVASPRLGKYNNPLTLFRDKDGRYWVATWGDGLWEVIPGDNFRRTCYRKQLLNNKRTRNPDERFFSIAQDNVFGYLWVMSYNSLYVLSASSHNGWLEPADIGESVDVNRMYTKIIKDRDGNLWLGSYDRGMLVTFSAESICNHPLHKLRDDLDWTPNLLTLCRSKAGDFWFNQDRFGICLQRENDNRLVYGSPDVCRLTLDSRVMSEGESMRDVWIADPYRPVVYLLKQQDGRIVLVKNVDFGRVTNELQFIRKIKEYNGCLWALCRDQLIACNLRTYDFTVMTAASSWQNFTVGAEGQIWAVSETNELYEVTCYKDGKTDCVWRCSILLDRDETVLHVCEDEAQTIWLVTSKGRIIRSDREKGAFTEYTGQFATEGDRILNMMSAGNYVWIITHRRVICYDTSRQKQTLYAMSDDYITVKICRDQASCIDEGGVLYVGGTGGFTTIIPTRDSVEDRSRSITCALSDIKVDGKSLFFAPDAQRDAGTDAVSRIDIPAGARNISLDFTGFDYSSARSCHYAYRMTGTDSRWIELNEKEHAAFYNKLEKGEHCFYVRCTDKSGKGASECLLVTLYQTPAWYETLWARFLYVLIAVLLAYGVLRLYLHRLKIRNDRHLEDALTRTKLDYFTNISHELLTPLTLISCVADYWRIHYSQEQAQTSVLYNNVYRLRHLLRQVLDFRKMERGALRLNVREVEITAPVRQLCSTYFYPLAQQKQLHVQLSIPAEELVGYLDFDKVDTILYNLLSNAVKYTPMRKTVRFDMEICEEAGMRSVVFKVQDEGPGIPRKEHDLVFKRFYTGTNAQGVSNGIGLSLTKELVELHHGSIVLDSVPMEGTSVTVKIPIDGAIYTTEERTVEFVGEAMNVAKSSRSVIQNADEVDRNEHLVQRPVIMIVDDNQELLGIMCRLFISEYDVVTARDGQEAFDLLKSRNVDVVVSDVMMPGIDGYAFCRALKSDVDTSHIPVILLTARHSIDDRIAGYDSGADGYMVKPFEPEVLRAKIDNLLRARRARQQAFRVEDHVRLTELECRSEDVDFLQSVTDYIYSQLDSEGLGLEQLADHLRLSKSTLHRKIKAITGLTPFEFIRNIKLKYACEMLLERGMSISEVAYATGFSTPKYFTKCFKEEMGLTPSEYQRKHGK